MSIEAADVLMRKSADNVVKVDYPQLRSAWAQTAKQAAQLDRTNKALVVNYLASAAQHTAEVLRTHANDPIAAADADAYAKSMREQDILRKGYSAGKKLWTALGFGSVIGVVIGGAIGLLSIFSDAAQAGAQTDLKPTIAAITGSGAVMYAIIRGIATGGPAAADGISEAWNDLWRSADPAKNLVSSKLDAHEKAFFAELGASPPSHAALAVFGPGAAFTYMAMIGIPVALVVVFLYSSLGGATSEPANTTFP